MDRWAQTLALARTAAKMLPFQRFCLAQVLPDATAAFCMANRTSSKRSWGLHTEGPINGNNAAQAGAC